MKAYVKLLIALQLSMYDTKAQHIECLNACKKFQEAQMSLQNTRVHGTACSQWWHLFQHCPNKSEYCPEECRNLGQERDYAFERLRQSCYNAPCNLRYGLLKQCNWCEYFKTFPNPEGVLCF